MRVIVSSTGTGEGKTWLARGLTRALAQRGVSVAALKPFETGVEGAPLDARALERAARVATGAFEHPAFLRARLPLSPRGAALAGDPATDLTKLRAAIAELGHAREVTLVESAGGLFVPLSPHAVFVDLIEPRDRVVLVAQNRLGVLSHVIAATRAAAAALREASCRVVLVEPETRDPSSDSNLRILEEQGLLVSAFARCDDDDDELARCAEASGVVSWLFEA